MINESIYWRKELLRISTSLKKKKDINIWTNVKNAEFEKEIMIGFFIIRKLIESNKLTNRIISTNIKGLKYPSNGKKINLMNNHKFLEFYDFKKESIAKFDLQFLINLFVHSYIFFAILEVTDENYKYEDNETSYEYSKIYAKAPKKITSILFNSDTLKDEFLYEIELEKITNLFDTIGKCEVTARKMKFNAKKNDYDIFQTDEKTQITTEMERMLTELESNKL